MSSEFFDEDLLYQAIKATMASEIEQLELETANFHHTFSEDFLIRMNEMTSKKKSLNFIPTSRCKHRIRLKFLLVAVLIMILSSAQR